MALKRKAASEAARNAKRIQRQAGLDSSGKSFLRTVNILSKLMPFHRSNLRGASF